MSFAIDKVASLVGGIKFEELPGHVIKKAKIALLNYIAGAMLGFDSTPSLSERNVWNSLCGNGGGCTIIGHSGKYGMLAAASVNATMGQYVFQEDCHERSISHPGVGIIPAVIAVSQNYHLDGKKIIEAIISGYEAQGLIGRGLILSGFARNGLRPASIVGVFGSAAATAVLLGLSSDLISESLSIAGNLSSGVMEFSKTGTDDICIQNCYIAKNGIQSAFEAKYGLKGSASILDGQFGLAHALNDGNEFDASVFCKDYFEIEDTFIKRYPFCGHVLLVAQAITDICQKHEIDSLNVDKIEIEVGSLGKTFPGCDNPGPYPGVVSAMMSHQFAVASTIVLGKNDWELVMGYSDPAIEMLAKKISVMSNDKFTYEPGAVVTVYLKDGSVFYSSQKDICYLSDEEVVERMQKNGRRCFSAARIEKIIDMVLNLDQIEDACKTFDLLELEAT